MRKIAKLFMDKMQTSRNCNQCIKSLTRQGEKAKKIIRWIFWWNKIATKVCDDLQKNRPSSNATTVSVQQTFFYKLNRRFFIM